MTQTFSAARQALLAVVLIATPVALFSGYELYAVTGAQAASTSLGDLSSFKTIIADTQALVDKGDLEGAKNRITDYETAWDQAETAIRPLNKTQWSNIDQVNDGTFSAIRKSNPDIAAVKTALQALMAELNDPSKVL